MSSWTRRKASKWPRYSYSSSVHLPNHLQVYRDQILRRGRSVSDVVDPLQQNDHARSGLNQHITRKARRSRVAKQQQRANREQFIAGDSGIGHRECRPSASSQPLGKVIGISVVSVVAGSNAVGDLFSHPNHGSDELWLSCDVDS